MRRVDGRSAFTLVELVLVLAIMIVLGGLAMPAVGRIREASALQNARSAVTSALSAAQTAGTQWGRTSVLRIDDAAATMRVVVDTGSTAGRTDTLVVRTYRLRDDQGVTFRSDRTALCFDGTGVATYAAECAEVGGRIVLAWGARRDTVRINPAGRVIR